MLVGSSNNLVLDDTSRDVSLLYFQQSKDMSISSMLEAVSNELFRHAPHVSLMTSSLVPNVPIIDEPGLTTQGVHTLPTGNTHHILTRAKTDHSKSRAFLTTIEPTLVK